LRGFGEDRMQIGGAGGCEKALYADNGFEFELIVDELFGGHWALVEE